MNWDRYEAWWVKRGQALDAGIGWCFKHPMTIITAEWVSTAVIGGVGVGLWQWEIWPVGIFWSILAFISFVAVLSESALTR